MLLKTLADEIAAWASRLNLKKLFTPLHWPNKNDGMSITQAMALSAGSLSVLAATMWQRLLLVGPRKFESNCMLNGELDHCITSWPNVAKENLVRVPDPWPSCGV